MAEMWRILKPGGIVLANVAALDVLRGSHSTLTMEVRRYTQSAPPCGCSNARASPSSGMTFTNMATFPITLAVRVKPIG